MKMGIQCGAGMSAPGLAQGKLEKPKMTRHPPPICCYVSQVLHCKCPEIRYWLNGTDVRTSLGAHKILAN